MSITPELPIETNSAIEIIKSLGMNVVYVPMVEYPISKQAYEQITIWEAMRRIRASETFMK